MDVHVYEIHITIHLKYPFQDTYLHTAFGDAQMSV